MATTATLICTTTDSGQLERTRFFPRQLVTPDDLTQDQIYFREKSRRHNRLLHGWGVVCGARCKQGTGACEIIIEPGYLLGPYGDEIVIDREVSVDLCREGLDGNAVEPCSGVLDPWCSDVRVDRPAGQTLYVAIRYAECQARPVRVATNGCGCDTAACEYSRIRDSYAMKVLTRLPSTYTDPMPEPDLRDSVSCGQSASRADHSCPPCPTEPWIILADVTLTAGGQVERVDCFRHRRYVVSFAEYYFLCQGQANVPGGRQVNARDIIHLLGHATLVELPMEMTATPPAATVSLRHMDGTWISLPVRFEVRPGDTYAIFLGREGAREFYDSITDDTYALREFYTLAQVSAQESIMDLPMALMPLEGLRLRISDLRVVRAGLVELLNGEGMSRLEQQHVGAPSAAETLPATGLNGVALDSLLGRILAETTPTIAIADIAVHPNPAIFFEMLLTTPIGHSLPPPALEQLQRQASDVWPRARRVSALSQAWHNE